MWQRQSYRYSVIMKIARLLGRMPESFGLEDISPMGMQMI